MIIKASVLNPEQSFTMGGLEYLKGTYIPFYDNKTVNEQGEVNKDSIRVGIRSKADIDNILQEPIPVTSWSNGTTDYSDFDTLLTDITGLLFNLAGESAALQTASSGYSSTGAFAGKSISNNFVWQNGDGISYSQTDVDNGIFKVFSLDEAVHFAVDNPYWTTPTPTGTTGIGLFQGANLPSGVTSLMDYTYVFNDNYPSNGTTGFEGSTGRIKLNDFSMETN